MTQRKTFQPQTCYVSIEDLVPQEHFLRKLASEIDFSFIYDETKELHRQNPTIPEIDPVVVVKFLLIGYLYNLESERRIEQEIQVNMAFRWFLGLNIKDKVPAYDAITQNRRIEHNGKRVYTKLFERVLAKCIEKGFVDIKTLARSS